MNYKLLSAIINGTWAIDENYAIRMGSFVNSLIKGENVMLDEKAEYPYVVSVKDENSKTSGTVMVIPVKGVLMKDDQYCGPKGTATIGQKIINADNNPDIDAIVLDFDTPGGTVDGIQVFTDNIKGTKKPVVGFINGLIASAGVFAGSACNKLIASTEHDEIGSIGVMVSFMDLQPAWEKEGVVFHEVYSSLSGDKNAEFNKLREGKYDDYIKNKLDPLALNFQKTVKENRPNVKDNQMTGKIYFAKDVIGTLIDEIGTLDYAITEALNLAKSNTNLNNQTMSEKDKKIDLSNEKEAVSLFQKVFGLKTVAQKKEEAEKLEAEKAEKEKVAKEAKEKEEADQIAAEELKIATEKIAELEKENAKLKGKPGAQTTTAVKETDGNDDADPAKIAMPEGASVTERFAAFKNALDKARV